MPPATFKLDLDLYVYFIPPMDDGMGGIPFTRTLELPFAPFEGLMVYGREIDDCPDPIGYQLKEVIWDLDRQVFLAHASHINHDFPIGLIPDMLRDFRNHGWRLGSYRDTYEEPDEPAPAAGESTVESPDLGEAERLHLTTPKRRPAPFNRFMKALVRHMAENFNNLEVAFAMDRTGCYIPEEPDPKVSEASREKWKSATQEFARMPQADRFAWRDRVGKYPSLMDALGK